MTRNWLISALSLSVALASSAATPPGHVAITAAQVASAITGAGMSVSADQVSLLTDVVAASASPKLEVQSMEPWGDRRMRVRLSCANQEDCLPFFVAVRFNQDSTAQSALAASGSSSSARIDPKSFVVRAGAPAILLLEGTHVHIRIAVVCLEGGAPGQTIRVSSRDHRQTYMAKVVDETILRASL
jgi:hypothetical protein